MKYMGSKARIAKYILPIVLKDRKSGQWYVEPFVGGANMIDKVTGNRIGADINEYLIAALELIRDNPESLPKNNLEFTEDDYHKIKSNGIHNKGLYGYAGFAFSYGAKWFGGWCRDGENKRDYVEEAYKNSIKQTKKLSMVKISCATYDTLDIPPHSIIYCDPPYASTTKYDATNGFDHNIFWQWCRDKTNEGHLVFISEYSAPDDFECLWQKEIVSSLDKDTGSKRATEKLFRYNPDWKQKQTYVLKGLFE